MATAPGASLCDSLLFPAQRKRLLRLQQGCAGGQDHANDLSTSYLLFTNFFYFLAFLVTYFYVVTKQLHPTSNFALRQSLEPILGEGYKDVSSPIDAMA